MRPVSATRAEYEARRNKTGATADDQWALARWCEKNGLDAEATAHDTAERYSAPDTIRRLAKDADGIIIRSKLPDAVLRLFGPTPAGNELYEARCLALADQLGVESDRPIGER